MNKQLHPIFSIIIYPIAIVCALLLFLKKKLVDGIAFLLFWVLTLRIMKHEKRNCIACGEIFTVADFQNGNMCSGCYEYYN